MWVYNKIFGEKKITSEIHTETNVFGAKPGLGGQTVLGGPRRTPAIRSTAHYSIRSYARRRYVGGGGDNGDIELSLPVIIVYDWGRLLNHDDNVGL